MLRNYLKVALKVFWRHKYFTVVNLLGICTTLVAAIIATMILDMQIGEVTGNAIRRRSTTTELCISRE